jgi:putative tricarboxylic transport membrane protein
LSERPAAMQPLTRSRDAQAGLVVAGLVVALLGAVYLASAFWIEPDPSTTSVVGPQVAPIVIGAAMVVGAVMLVVQGLRTHDAEPTNAADPTTTAELTELAAPPTQQERARSQRQVLVVSGIFAAYIVAFIPLGYLLSTFLFLVALTTYVERHKLVRNLIYGALFAPLVYVLFTYGLEVQLPAPGVLE